jgi:hypothetical protein
MITMAAACGANDADGGDDKPHPGGPAATEEEIAACKDACDQLKFFDCNDSVDQAGCYANCSAASSSQIELFVACVKADICDPTCSTHIEPVNPDPTTTGGNGSSSCSSDGCGSSGDPPGNQACEDACDKLQFFDCIDAGTFSTCMSLCSSAETSKKDTFSSCVESASVDQCQAVDCYYQFDESAVPGPTPKQIADCKKSCADLAFFDCITGTDAAACNAACDTSTKQEIEAFLACTADPTDCAAAAQCL